MADECEVLPGILGLVVQMALFLCCVGILVVKKVREGSERTWFDFMLDGSKQFIGAGYIHLLNLLFSMHMGFEGSMRLLAAEVQGDSTEGG